MNSRSIMSSAVLLSLVAQLLIPAESTQAQCPAPNSAYGPCSDTGASECSGGPGMCGACTDKVCVFAGGSCSSGSGGSEEYDCRDCQMLLTGTQVHTSVPRSPAQIAACYAAWLVCDGYFAVGGALFGVSCGGACGSLGGGPYGAAACGALCAAPYMAAGGSLCDCFYSECIELCTAPQPPVWSGPGPACT